MRLRSRRIAIGCAVHFAEPNLVLLVLVDTANIRRAVSGLAADGYFDAIRAEGDPA